MKASKKIIIDQIVKDFNALDDAMRVQLICIGEDAMRKHLKKFNKPELLRMLGKENE